MDPQYFDHDPARPSVIVEVRMTIEGCDLMLATDRGVFAHGRIDAGTQVLLRVAPAPPQRGEILDLGCGSGAIALSLAVRAPGARVWAVDVNERALSLTRRNAEANGLTNVVVSRPEDMSRSVWFDAIYSNPPIRIGAGRLLDLLERWLNRLRDHANGYLVVKKNLGADRLTSCLQSHGYPVRRLASKRGYRVLEVAQRAHV